MINIALINEYQPLSEAQVLAATDALKKQLANDFAPVWGKNANLQFFPAGVNPPDDFWQLVILDNTDQAGFLGYHDITETGQPLGKIFAGTDALFQSSWTVTASHELLEMIVDPNINLTATKSNQDGTHTLYAYEVCDACDADQFGYEIDGIKVSNFVFPSWFQEFSGPGTVYDFCHKITAPFQLLPGGTINIYDDNSGWTQLSGRRGSLKYHMRPPVGSRRERRRTHKGQWLKSAR